MGWGGSERARDRETKWANLSRGKQLQQGSFSGLKKRSFVCVFVEQQKHLTF